MPRRVRTVQTRASSRPQPPTSVPASVSSTSPSSATPEPHLFPTPTAFQTWLDTNHDTNNGIWLRLNKKGSTVPAITYDQALDLALCYGWIDGQKKTHDASHFLQRFTPRRKHSIWSQRNVAKVAALTASGLMRASGQAEVDAAKADGRWERAYAGSSAAQTPADFQAALDQSKQAAEFWEALGRSQRYAFIWRIETTKRAETRRRKIGQFVELLEKRECL